MGSRSCLCDRLFNDYSDRLRHFFFFLFYNLLNNFSFNRYFLNHLSWSFFNLNVRFDDLDSLNDNFGFDLLDWDIRFVIDETSCLMGLTLFVTLIIVSLIDNEVLLVALFLLWQQVILVLCNTLLLLSLLMIRLLVNNSRWHVRCNSLLKFIVNRTISGCLLYWMNSLLSDVSWKDRGNNRGAFSIPYLLIALNLSLKTLILYFNNPIFFWLVLLYDDLFWVFFWIVFSTTIDTVACLSLLTGNYRSSGCNLLTLFLNLYCHQHFAISKWCFRSNSNSNYLVLVFSISHIDKACLSNATGLNSIWLLSIGLGPLLLF